jgi:ArsR family transcriptional regulator, arsenate/arsenite/antimonite-responsive transcriptional repressor
MAADTTTRPVPINEGCCAPGTPARERWPFIAEDARLLKVLADETRLGIIQQLREQGEVCQCDFAACCTVQQPTVSHHLRVLRDAGVVVGDKRGVWVYYRLNPAALAGLRRYLA